MTDPQSDTVVQQAFFGWSQDRNAVVLLSHSFANDEEGGRYARKLEPHIRLQPVGTNAVPFHALSYIDLGGETMAVLRRVRVGHSSGRNNSHALIASNSVLDLRTALGLGDWPMWKGQVSLGLPMPPLSAELFTGGDPAFNRLKRQSAEIGRDLVAVLTRLLDHPEEPLSVIGCQDKNRLAMVQALAWASDGFLRNEFGATRRWTFSTYEDRHDISIERLPELIFLPEKPSSAAFVQRTIVDLGKGPADGPNRALAAQLVEAYLDDAPYTRQEPVRQRAVPPGSGSYSGALREDGNHPVRGDFRAAMTGLGPDEPQHWDGGTHVHPSPRQERVPAGRNPAAALLRAKSVRDFDLELEKLEMEPNYREELRAAFDLGAVDAVADFAEITAGREFLQRLLTVMYGPKRQDLSDPGVVKHATRVIRNGRSDQLAALLAESAMQKDGGVVLRAVYERWAETRNPRKPPVTHWAARTMRLVRRGRFLPLVAVVAALALLGIVFLLGFLAGRPNPVQVVSVTSQSGTSSQTVTAPGTQVSRLLQPVALAGVASHLVPRAGCASGSSASRSTGSCGP